MNFNDYQALSISSAVYPAKDKITYPMIGLCSEVGEVADKIKKNMRDGNTFSKEDIKKELGDVLWYVSALANDLDIRLDDIAQSNIFKLQKRLEEDKIHGSGDDR